MQSSDNSTDSSDASTGQHDGPNFDTERVLPSVVSTCIYCNLIGRKYIYHICPDIYLFIYLFVCLFIVS